MACMERSSFSVQKCSVICVCDSMLLAGLWVEEVVSSGQMARVTIHTIHRLVELLFTLRTPPLGPGQHWPATQLATGHTHSWKLATVLSLRQQDYSFLNFLSSETMDYDVDIYPKSLFIEVLLSPIAGKHQVTQTLRMVELYFLRLDNLPDKKTTI